MHCYSKICLARTIRGSIARSTITLLVFFATSGNAAEPGPFVFDDTPKNRQLIDQTSQNYRDIDARHSRFAELNGIRMHYLEWGNEDGIPLIWSHGYSSTGFELSEVGPALAEAGYHVLSITYRGHGQTQVEDYDFSLYTVADDIAALMDQRGFSCAVIGGLSLGGGVTTAFYASYPERTMALVLEDGGSIWPQKTTESLAEMMQDLPPEAREPPPMPTQFDSEFDAAATVFPLYMQGAPRPLNVGMATMFYSFLRQTPDGEWVFHIDSDRLFGTPELMMDPAAGGQLPLLHQSWRSLLPEVIYRKLSVPMLLIDPTGDDNQFISFVEDNRLLAEQHPEWIHHIQYPDTPHIAHPNRPEWFLRDMKLLQEWIAASGSDTCIQ